MNKYISNLIKETKQPKIFLKWLLFACIIGLVVGAVSTGFYYALNFVTEIRTAHNWLIYLLPAGGVVIVLLYRFSGMEKDKGTNFVLIAVRENADLPLRTAPLVFVSTVITHLFGGSAGREGAILQIGGSISSSIGRAMHLDENDSRIITMCGMSAAFAALFGTPLTAAIFAMEVISVGVMYYTALVPCVLSAIVGVSFAKFCGVTAACYSFIDMPIFSVSLLIRVIALGISFAILSIIFCRLMQLTPVLFDKYLPNHLSRVIVGGALVIILTLITGTYDYNGFGGNIISEALSGSARPEAFLLKILFTTITLGAGFKGGEIVPVFFTGATFGCVAAPLLGISPSFGAALGLVSVFCGVTNCPMTSIMLALELFGGKQMPLFALCCAVSYMLSGYYSLYSEQKILYSKLRPVFIDKKAK
ncbi:MAG: chloride channel protein [Clostridia bacterium]|nr:chloride channel protein [Clostridia bacterium]